jgi:hypothetical protein
MIGTNFASYSLIVEIGLPLEVKPTTMVFERLYRQACPCFANFA